MNQTGKKILAGVVLTVTMMVLLLSVTAFTAHAATGSCGKQCQWTLSGKTKKRRCGLAILVAFMVPSSIFSIRNIKTKD